MITGVFGGPGSGKTLYALFLMEQAALAGRPIYSNIALTPACWFQSRVALIDTPEFPVVRGEPTDRKGRRNPDYLAYWHYIRRDSVVVIDEANIYFDCSDFGSFASDARQFHQQHRKFGIDVIYLCQNLPNLWVRIRRLLGRFILCEWNYRSSRVFKHCPIWLSRFLRSEFGDELFRDHRGDGYFTYREARRFFPWYETEQLLGDTSFYRSLHNGNVKSVDVGGSAGQSGSSDGGRGSASRSGAASSGPVAVAGGRGGLSGRGLQGVDVLEVVGSGGVPCGAVAGGAGGGA